MTFCRAEKIQHDLVSRKSIWAVDIKLFFDRQLTYAQQPARLCAVHREKCSSLWTFTLAGQPPRATQTYLSLLRDALISALLYSQVLDIFSST